MSIDEQPTVKHLREQMTGVSVVLRINKLLQSIGLGSKRIADIEPQYQQMRQQLREYTEYPKRFNEIFSADGWLAHDSLSFDVLKKAVDICTVHGKPQAVNVLLDYYGAEQVAERAFFFNHVEELRVRRRFINFALTEHAQERYYSAVPLLLMVIDGAVNDAIGKGFHASDLNLDVWDSLMATDGSIYGIKEIFQKGRKKTRREPIDMPYRNGILHGMDLGYDNPTVVAKCWCFLFVVRDWILSKQSESERKETFKKETRVPSLGEISVQLTATKRLREATEAWEARSITAEYIASLVDPTASMPGSPEAVVLQCLKLWEQRNYGGMAGLFWKKMVANPKAYVREVRQQFEHIHVGTFTIKRIVDEAPAIGEVDVEIDCSADGTETSCWKFRLIREDENGDPIPANLTGGCWQIVWIHRQRRNEPEGEQVDGDGLGSAGASPSHSS